MSARLAAVVLVGSGEKSKHEHLPSHQCAITKDYKDGYRLASKINSGSVHETLTYAYTVHCTVQYRQTSWIECCKVLASFCG
jgi:hypothetical protein